jgi:uncharacterized membrane protein (DUF2068 family)
MGPDRSASAPQQAGIEFLAPASAPPMTAPVPDNYGAVQAPASATDAKKPFGLVWIVFYWILSGLGFLVGGFVSMMGGLAGSATIREFEGSRGMFGSSEMSEPGALAAVAVFCGILFFHFGLLMLVTCYGLWTFRRWGLSLARGLSIACVAMCVAVFFIIPLTRTTFLAGLIALVIASGIVVYLYGSADLRDRLHRYMGGGHLQGGDWQRFN